jgi:hypothetical protein
MHLKKLMVLGTASLAVVGSLTGAALASNKGATAPRKAVAAVKVADTDNIQAGDQTSPDNASQAKEASALAAKAAAPAKASASTSSTSSASPKANESENPGENPENSGESDGPGGHEDPPGQDVNNEFQGEQ